MIEYLLYAFLALILAFLLLVGAPFIVGRLLPGAGFAFMRRFGAFSERLFHFIKPDMDIKILVAASNCYYKKTYQRTPYSQRFVFLPFCLKPQNCPAPITAEEGLLCRGQCQGCKLGELRQEALALGYSRVYVVPSSRLVKGLNLPPSSQFIKAKIAQYQPRAALGVICAWHLRNRLLPSHKKVGRQGYVTQDKQKGAALFGVLLEGKNCAAAKVDWDRLRNAMHLHDA